MKILFLADVHVGNYRFPIRPYINESMAQVAVIAMEERPDLIMFAGDAFKTKVPSSADLADFGDFIGTLAAVAPVLMIPGNHDFLGSGRTTISVYEHYENVTFVPNPRMFVMEGVQIVTIPWLPSKALSSSGLDAEDTVGAQRALLKMLKAKLVPDFPSFLLGHATALGTVYHDDASSILGNEVLWTNDLFDGFDLAVLGHIHKPQRITDNAFYVGSICPVSFNEERQNKRVLIWEDGHIHNIGLETPSFVRLAARDLAANTQSDFTNSFLKITKELDEPDPDVPECIWHEIKPKPIEREFRTRIREGLTAKEAIIEALTLDGVDEEKIHTILELVDEIMEEA